MTARRGAGRRCGIAVAAAVTMTAVTMTVAACGAAGGNTVPPDRSTSPDRPSTTGTACELRVTETGFVDQSGLVDGRQVTAANGSIRFAFVVVNPCSQVALHTGYEATAADRTGRPLRTQDGRAAVGRSGQVPDLLPGERIGLSATIVNSRGSALTGDAYDPTQVSAVTVELRDTGWRSAASGLPSVAASAGNIRLGARGPDGYLPVTYTLHTDGPLRDDWMSIIVRDGTGRIVTGEQRRFDKAGPASGDTVHTAVWIPAGLTDPHIEIFFVPGTS